MEDKANVAISEHVEFHYDSKKLRRFIIGLFFCLVLIAFMGAGWSVFNTQFWISLGLYSVAGFLFAKKMLAALHSGKPRLVICRDGIAPFGDRDVQLIGWEEIQRVEPRPTTEPNLVRLRLRTGTKKVEIQTRFIEGNGEEVLEAMRRYYPSIIIEGRPRN